MDSFIFSVSFSRKSIINWVCIRACPLVRVCIHSHKHFIYKGIIRNKDSIFIISWIVVGGLWLFLHICMCVYQKCTCHRKCTLSIRAGVEGGEFVYVCVFCLHLYRCKAIFTSSNYSKLYDTRINLTTSRRHMQLNWNMYIYKCMYICNIMLYNIVSERHPR